MRVLPNHSLKSGPFDAPFGELRACSGLLNSAVLFFGKFYRSIFYEDFSDLPD